MCTVWLPQATWFSLQFQDRQNVEAKILDSRHESPKPGEPAGPGND